MQALDAIPANVRRWLYLVITLVSVALFACKAYFDALGIFAPDWLTGALGSISYLTAALGIVAYAHTPKTGEGETLTVVEAPAEVETPETGETVADADEFEPLPVNLEE